MKYKNENHDGETSTHGNSTTYYAPKSRNALKQI